MNTETKVAHVTLSLQYIPKIYFRIHFLQSYKAVGIIPGILHGNSHSISSGHLRQVPFLN